jgi:two-component system, NtrC family, sensor histidine kinase KinB
MDAFRDREHLTNGRHPRRIAPVRMRLSPRQFVVPYVALAAGLVVVPAVAVGAILIAASGPGITPALSLPIVVALAITIVCASLAYRLAHRAQKPLSILAESVARLREGDPPMPTPTIQVPGLIPLLEELERARLRVHATLTTIADAEERERALFAVLREPVLTTSIDGRITSFNAAAKELLGDPIRLYGQRLNEILPFIEVSADDGDRSRWDGRITGPDGVARDLEVVRTRAVSETFPLTDIYVVHDVTHHVELGRTREQLLYSVAHEVRSPIAILDNVLDILAHEGETLTTDEQRHLARSARSTVARLHNIIESLLSAGSIQSGRFEVHPQPSWLGPIIDDAVQAALPLVEARNQQIQRQDPTEDLHVVADRHYVRQLLWNLLSNASKYGPDGDEIRLWTEGMESYVRVIVEDHGRGIPIEQQSGLFERFYRAQSGEDTEGIGLGLAIAKAIVDAHGGKIGIESTPGEGTRVWFTLPVPAEHEA